MPQLGLFDAVWAGDSLTAKPRLEPLSVLAAVAGVTSRVRLGTSVLLAALRQPDQPPVHGSHDHQHERNQPQLFQHDAPPRKRGKGDDT